MVSWQAFPSLYAVNFRINFFSFNFYINVDIASFFKSKFLGNMWFRQLLMY